MRAKIGRLVGLLCSLGLALIIATPLWAGSATYDYDDFGRLIEVLYDDGTRIVYTYDDAGNRLTQVITVPAPEADLGLSITDSPDPVVQGSDVIYTVTVTNNGPDGATGVTLTAALPAGTTLVSATPSEGICDAAVSCSLGAIASLGTATVDIVVSADAAGTIAYPMSVSATEADPNGGNDSATANTTVDPSTGGDIIVDDLDPGGTQIGSWNTTTDTASFAGQALWSKKAGAIFEWHFTIPTTGTYQVYAWWVRHPKHTTTAPYTIHHAGGSNVITVDQSNAALEGQWNLLGSFTFNAGTSHFVEIDTTNGQVSADAVKLVAQ